MSTCVGGGVYVYICLFVWLLMRSCTPVVGGTNKKLKKWIPCFVRTGHVKNIFG